MTAVAAPPLVMPRYRSKVMYPASRGAEVIKFGHTHLRNTKGPQTGTPLRYLQWEQYVIQELYELAEWEGGNLKHRYRRGLVGVGRQNGKSIVGAGLALEGLFAGPAGSEIYSAAGDRQQGRIVFGEARRQVEQNERLAKFAKVYRDAIEIPSTGNVYRVLSADSKLQQGLSPQLVIFDEVHVQPNEELWDALAFGMAARPNALMLGITTAGDHEDTLCGRLYEYGKRVASGEEDDPSFFFQWWEPHHDRADIWDREAWHQANPALSEGVLLEEDLEIAAKQSRPASFRRYRLNQWVAHGGSRWMDMEAWDECEDDELEMDSGESIVLAFDGSVDNDSTVLTALRLKSKVPTVVGVWAWERQPEDGDDWQVDRVEVNSVVEGLFNEYKVVAMGCDPAYWRSEIQEWQSRYGRKVMEWPVTNARMGPAVTETYKRVKDGELAHNGNPLLRRHVHNAVEKPVSGGHVTIRKQSPKSTFKIDGAVTLCIGVDLWNRYRSRNRGMRSM